jgi:hypothetical protein
MWFMASVALPVVAIPSVAAANMALPVVVFAVPGMALMAVPVVAIETWFLIRWSGIATSRAVSVVFRANVISTLLGLPAVWVVTYGVVSPLSSALDVPGLDWVSSAMSVGTRYPGTPSLGMSLLIMLPVFFLGSWLVERYVARMLLKGVDRSLVDRAVLFGNLASYLLITAVLVLLDFADV